MKCRNIQSISLHLICLVLGGLVLLGASCGSPQDGGVFRSLDKGEIWEARNFISQEGRRTQTIASANVSSFTFHPDDSNVIFLGTKGSGIYVTVDAGEHWSQGQITSGNIYDIAFDPVDPELVYVAKDTSIVKSLDSGKTWETVYTDVKGAKINSLVVDSFEHSRVYAGTSAGAVFKSIDFGVNWDLRLQMEEPVVKLLIPDYNTRVIYALLGDGTIYKSTRNAEPVNDDKVDEVNSGWKQLITEEVREEFDGSLDAFDIALDPSNQSVLYMATKRGLMRGADDGTQWNDIPTLFGFNESENEKIRNITIAPDNAETIYFTADRAIHRSTDSGKTWSVIENFPSTRPITTFNIDPAATNVIYAGTELVEKQKGLIKQKE